MPHCPATRMDQTSPQQSHAGAGQARILLFAVIALAAISLGKANAQDSPDPPLCDISPYQQHIKDVLDQDEANAMPSQMALFTQLEQTGVPLYQGVVGFNVTPDGHTVDVAMTQSTGAPKLDFLILGIARSASFGPFLACMNPQAIPMFVPFQVAP